MVSYWKQFACSKDISRVGRDKAFFLLLQYKYNLQNYDI